jgi:hypothetical protein
VEPSAAAGVAGGAVAVTRGLPFREGSAAGGVGGWEVSAVFTAEGKTACSVASRINKGLALGLHEVLHESSKACVMSAGWAGGSAVTLGRWGGWSVFLLGDG